jgi:hypothetical protein
MDSQTKVDKKKEFVREFVQRALNEHDPDRASEYFTPDATWRGGNWREDRSTGCSAWPDQLSGSPLIY